MDRKHRTHPVVLLLRALIVVGIVAVLCVTKQETFRSFLLPSRYAAKPVDVASREIADREKAVDAREKQLAIQEANLEIEKGLARANVARSLEADSPTFSGEWHGDEHDIRFKLLVSPDAACRLLVLKGDAVTMAATGATVNNSDGTRSGKLIVSPNFHVQDHHYEISLRLEGSSKMWMSLCFKNTEDQSIYSEGLVVLRRTE